MLQRMDASDPIRSSGSFLADEVPYNLIHRIVESPNSTCLKTFDNTLIYAGSVGHSAWLWLSKDVSSEQRNDLFQELISSKS